MPPGSRGDTLYLLDANALIFQVFHAIPEMSSPTGLPTNAVFGFTRDLLYIRTELEPTLLVCVFDPPGPTFRDLLYKEYKANRGPMPEPLAEQLPMLRRLLDAMRVPVLQHEGFEADDVLATLATAGAARGLDVYLCTSDKDCRQLLSDKVRMYNLRKQQVFDVAALWADWGVTPAQVVDLQTLTGDSVDNVPGVPGIGPKTASKLLQEYGTLENIVAHIDEISGDKRRENLRAAATPGGALELGRQLVRLKTDVPCPLTWDDWRLRPVDRNRLLALCQEWGFHRFADQVRTLPADDGAPPARRGRVAAERTAGVSQNDLFGNDADDADDADDGPQGDLSSEGTGPVESGAGELFPFGANATAGPAAPPWTGEYHLVNTPDLFSAFVERLRAARRFAVDLETTSLEPRRADIVGMAFCWKPEEAWYLPLLGPAGEPVLDRQTTLDTLRPMLENPAVAKVNQNIKYDLLVLRQHGVRLAGIAGDPMIADYLLHAGERSHGLKDLSNRYLDHQVIEITELIGAKGKQQVRMDEVPTARVAEYAGEDADVAWRLADHLEPRLAAAGLNTLYEQLEIPLLGVLANLEFNGVRLDVPVLERIGEEMTAQLAGLEAKIHQAAGREFNIDSTKQLREVLFKEQKFKARRKTAVTGEASTDQETLEALAAEGHELPRLIIEHRQIAKLKGTYVDALPKLVNPATGRVHTAFNQTVAATGRLSSSDPNLQNIPVRTEQGRQIRQAFVPEPGWTLLTADYSQIELRLLAHFCRDDTLRQAFAAGRDVHAAVAARLNNVPEEAVTPAMRRVAKTVNFGILYGISPHGLGQRLGMPQKEAASFIEEYFKRYPKVAEYQQHVLDECRKTRYVSTILGRRREISGIRARSSYQNRNQPEREAINMQIQGSAADLIKRAMLAIDRRLARDGYQARMLLQIHDELVFETPPDELRPLAGLIRDEMTTALALEVPLTVDLSAGPNWLEVNDISA